MISSIACSFNGWFGTQDNLPRRLDGKKATLHGRFLFVIHSWHTFFFPSIVYISCGDLSPCSATGLPGRWIFAALLRGQYYSAAAVRTHRQGMQGRQAGCPGALENGPCSFANLAAAHAAHMLPIQLCTVGIAFYILTKFQDRRQKTWAKSLLASFRVYPEHTKSVKSTTQ